MKEDLNFLVGFSIRKKRIEKQLTLNDLSFMCNISISHLRSLENGNKKFQIDTLIIILNALNINFFDFFNNINQ